MAYYTKFNALQVVTSSPWTRDLRHATAVIPRMWAKSVTWKDPKVKSVKPKDRIKWWNIVPGDQVRLLGDSEGTIHEVHKINKLTNRVYLKSPSTSEDTDNVKMTQSRQVPYSRCQLFVGNHKFPPLPGEKEPRNVPVFAVRLATTPPHWLPGAHRYNWSRYAVATVPRLPGWTKEDPEQVLIPWPQKSTRKIPEPSLYDSSADAVAEMTYVPPALPESPKSFVRPPLSEQLYIKALAKDSSGIDPSQPVEIYVHKELTNPHSRAKKQQRWQAFQMYKRSLLQDLIRAGLKDLKGRTRREARAEGTWKWKQRLAEERKTEMKRRWKNRGQEAALKAKAVRKQKKKTRLDKKLQDLVLQAAPNQVVPGSQLSA